MTETWTGRAACVLLAAVWFLSMGVADANAYSYTPLLAGLAVVILLALSAMIRGAKTVQLSKTAWLSLGVGAYFLIRCLCSPSVVESWQEAGTILGCGVFYVAGIYAAQGRSLRTVLLLLVIASALNLVYFGLMHYTDVPIEWTGRPAVGPSSVNQRPTTLFVYKNHAAAFLCMVGMLLFAAALWVKTCNGIQKFGLCALAVLCVIVSAKCHSRAQYLMAPAMLIGGWLLWVIIKLYEDDRPGVGIIMSCFVILGGLGVATGSAFMDSDIIHFFESLNDHSRFSIWRSCCRLLPETPPWGYGALSTQWHILTLRNPDLPFYGMPNFAHNEYLQAWVDYGLIGLGCMIIVIFAHLFRGFMILAEDSVSARQRTETALAMLCIGAWSLNSIVDFFWHHFAIAGMTAFAAGITASVYPYTDRRTGIRHLNGIQTPRSKGLLALIGVSAAGCCIWLTILTRQAWLAQWEYNRLAAPGADDTGEKRHDFLADMVSFYPATELMDTYFRIPHTHDDWKKETQLLRTVLASNPQQLHTAVMLAELLSRHGRYEEAEFVYRSYYPGDGLNRIPQADWPNSYALNLMRWGQYLWGTGDKQTAYSLMLYGLNIVDHQRHGWSANVCYRGEALWAEKGGYMPNWNRYLKARKQDVAVMRLLKVEPDDSWQAPDASGKPSLYRRYGAPESHEKADSAASAPTTAKKE